MGNYFLKLSNQIKRHILNLKKLENIGKCSWISFGSLLSKYELVRSRLWTYLGENFY